MGKAIVDHLSMIQMRRIMLAGALVASSWFFVRFSAGNYAKRYPLMPEAITSIKTFNDISYFNMDAANPRHFVYVSNSSPHDVYLRFAIPGIDPSHYILRLKIKARPELLKSAKIRSARDARQGGVVEGDVATFAISMKDSAPFLWTDGKCYVGLSFPKEIIRSGDTIELVDFKFELDI